MPGVDYVALGDGGPPSLITNPVKTAFGLFGAALVGWAGFASTQAKQLFSKKWDWSQPFGSSLHKLQHIPQEMPKGLLEEDWEGVDLGKTPNWLRFLPRRGVEQVLVHPGPPGFLPLVAPGQPVDPDAPHALFLYNTDQTPELTEGAAEQPGWVYGASLAENGQAVPTGVVADIVKGVLLRYWPEHFADKLQTADRLHHYVADKSGKVRRGEVSVVKEDGTWSRAYWYYQAASRPVPELFVFDLDDCLWTPEMYTLYELPHEAVIGDLNGRGKGVLGVRSGNDVIRLHPGALQVLQLIADGAFPHSRMAVASSANTPLAEECAAYALTHLEVLPGVTVDEILSRGFATGFTGNRQIGRTGKLSPDKRGHFKYIKEETGVDWAGMVFFDDNNWEDNVGRVEQSCPGVVGEATPHGLTLELFQKCLEGYAEARERDGKANIYN
eukprot:gb/GEZN01008270.1/.p1 GENE.gb/GEZN01008270.1/~~gb/GEZN01008270.1/.p1  ORF type:complete len:441 (-),score=75.63 gb/GEZN01008270.1/:40-1362(-)